MNLRERSELNNLQEQLPSGISRRKAEQNYFKSHSNLCLKEYWESVKQWLRPKEEVILMNQKLKKLFF